MQLHRLRANDRLVMLFCAAGLPSNGSPEAHLLSEGEVPRPL